MKKQLQARMNTFHFRPTGPEQIAQIEVAAFLLAGGNASKLFRMAVDALLEKHAEAIAQARPKYEEAQAALASLRES